MRKLLLLFVVYLLPMVVSADDSGKCGDNVTYTYNEATKTLTISGTGQMYNKLDPHYRWESYRDKIEIVIIEEGVTSIGNYAFFDCIGLTSVTIPNSATSIGYSAFFDCSALTSITIPNSVTSIESGAFDGCKLETVVIKSTNIRFKESSFSKRTHQHAMLFVPAGTWRYFVYESGWYVFNNIKEMSAETREVATSRAYTLMDAQTFNYVVYDGVNQTLCTKDGYYQVDESNPNTSWQVVDQGNKKYLYNIGARKYAAMKGDGDLSLSDTPVALDMRNGDKGIVLGNYPQKQWYFVLNQNVEAENIQTAIDGITTTDAQTSEVYSLSGVRTNRPQHGVSIVKMSDGTIKKVLVK